MATVDEEPFRGDPVRGLPDIELTDTVDSRPNSALVGGEAQSGRLSRRRRAGSAGKSMIGLGQGARQGPVYDADLVNLLDVIGEETHVQYSMTPLLTVI